jgi:hypothetical protein
MIRVVLHFFMATCLPLPAQDTYMDRGPLGGQSFGPSLFAGTFGGSIPIELPPPRHVGPALALQYDSSAQNTWMGRGWDLVIPYIERNIRDGSQGMYTYEPQSVILVTSSGRRFASTRTPPETQATNWCTP